MPSLQLLAPFVSGLTFGAALAFSGLPQMLSLFSSRESDGFNIHLLSPRGKLLGGNENGAIWVVVLQYVVLLSLVTALVSTLVVFFVNWFFFSTAATRAAASAGGGHFGAPPFQLMPRKPSAYGWFLYDGNVVGGMLQGLGMAIVKSEPGLVLWNFGAQFGSKWMGGGERGLLRRDTVWIVLGGLVGGLTYVLGNEWLKKPASGNIAQESIEVKDKKPERNNKQTLSAQEKVGLRPGFFAFAHVVILLSGICGLQSRMGNTGLSKYLGIGFLQVSTEGNLQAITGGVGIGLSQFVSILLTKGTLGVSSIYPVSAIHCLRLLGFSRPNPGYSSILFGLGVMLSGRLLRALVLVEILPIQSIEKNRIVSIFGGFLMIFGARLAGGCTSGHGISGCALLSISSFVTVFAMVCGMLLWAPLSHKFGEIFQ